MLVELIYQVQAPLNVCLSLFAFASVFQSIKEARFNFCKLIFQIALIELQ